MKTIAICSLVTLSLTTLSIRTEAASAPDGSHPVVSAVKEAAPAGRASGAVSRSRAGGGAGAGGGGGARSGGATRSSAAGTPKTQAARFHQSTAVASRKLRQAAAPVNTWFTGFNTRLAAATATTPAEQRQNAALATTQNRIYNDVTRINTAIAKLSTARTRKEAAADCDTVSQSAQDAIDFLHRDLVDVEAMKLIHAGDKKAGNALLFRGSKIAAGESVVTPLRNLIAAAHAQNETYRQENIAPRSAQMSAQVSQALAQGAPQGGSVQSQAKQNE